MCIHIENLNELSRPTPLRALLSSVEHSPFAIAPERALELAQIISQHRLLIRLDEHRASFSIGVMFERIVVPLRALEHLWAYAYGYSVLHDTYQPTVPDQRILMNAHPDFPKADGLIQWSQSGERSDALSEWPTHLPRPDQIREPRVHTANTIFLMMTGFILLHEVGHLVLQHASSDTITSEQSIANEHEADAWAVAWILEKWTSYNSDPGVFIQRTGGIAFGLATIDAIEVLFHRSQRSRSHPNIAERQLTFLDKWITSAKLYEGPVWDNAWRVALVPMAYHLHRLGLSDVVSRYYDHHRDFLVAARDRIAKLQKD